jgi:hypothetical protein
MGSVPCPIFGDVNDHDDEAVFYFSCQNEYIEAIVRQPIM